MKHPRGVTLSGPMFLGFAGLGPCTATGGGGGSGGSGILKPSDIGLQLYSIRGLAAGHDSGSAEDYNYIKALLTAVKKAGYQHIEAYNYWGLSPEQWKGMLQEVGLTVTGLHHGIPGNGIQHNGPTPLGAIQADAEVLQTYLGAFDLDYSIINYAGWTTASQWNIFFQALETYVDELHRRNIQVGFHSHNHEYGGFANDGATGVRDNVVSNRIFDRILEKVDSIELDIHWAARGGIVPVEAIREYTKPGGRYNRYKHKLQYLHLKDISIVSRNGNDIPARFEELGAGTINWSEVIRAGKEQGIKYYIVEQDGDYLPSLSLLEPRGMDTDFSEQGQIRSLQVSYHYLKQYLDPQFKEPETPNLDTYSPKIKPEQLSVQLYSIRSRLNPVSGNPAGIKKVLQEVKDIGYQNVELGNFLGLTGGQWKTILDELGLGVSSIHQNIIDAPSIESSEAQGGAARSAYPGDPQAYQKYAWDLQQEMIRNVKALGLDRIFIASGGFSAYDEGAYLSRINNFRNSLNSVNTGNAGADAWPIRVNYHTHSQEFAQPYSFKIDFLRDLLTASPAEVELDTHWALRAGVDPAELLIKYKGRIPYLHIKDISLVFTKASRDAGDETLIFNYEEIGDGTIGWDRLFRAGNYAGVKYYVVEQDANYLGGNLFNSGTQKDGTGSYFEEGDPLASIKKSYEYISAHHF